MQDRQMAERIRHMIQSPEWAFLMDRWVKEHELGAVALVCSVNPPEVLKNTATAIKTNLDVPAHLGAFAKDLIDREVNR
jgi:hypothetical protein